MVHAFTRNAIDIIILETEKREQGIYNDGWRFDKAFTTRSDSFVA